MIGGGADHGPGFGGKVTLAKSGADTAAIASIHADSGLPIELRQSRYLNNRVEHDHRAAKRIARPMLGFNTSRCARILIAGIEVIHRVRKDQLVGIKDRSSSDANQFCSLVFDRCRACRNAWPLPAIATDSLTPAAWRGVAVAGPARRVLRRIAYTNDSQGQVLIVTGYGSDGWTERAPVGHFSGADIVRNPPTTARTRTRTRTRTCTCTCSFTPSSRPS